MTFPTYQEAVAVECRYSTANLVTVAGTFNGWNTAANPLVPVGGGLWRTHLELPPGRHEYRLVVDGQWMSDPQAQTAVPNPFGSLNSVLVVARPRPG